MNKRQARRFKYTKAEHRRWDLLRKSILEAYGERGMALCIQNWQLPLSAVPGVSYIQGKLVLDKTNGSAILNAIHNANTSSHNGNMYADDERMTYTLLMNEDGAAVAYVVEPRRRNYKAASVYIVARGGKDDEFHVYSIMRILKFHNVSTIMKRRKKTHR